MIVQPHPHYYPTHSNRHPTLNTCCSTDGLQFILVQLQMESEGPEQSSLKVILGDSNNASTSWETISELIRSLQDSVEKTIHQGLPSNDRSSSTSIREKEHSSLSNNVTIRNLLLQMRSFLPQQSTDSMYYQLMEENIERIMEFAEESKERKRKLDQQNETLLEEIKKVDTKYQYEPHSQHLHKSSDVRDKTEQYRESYLKYKELNAKYQEKLDKIHQCLKQ